MTFFPLHRDTVFTCKIINREKWTKQSKAILTVTDSHSTFINVERRLRNTGRSYVAGMNRCWQKLQPWRNGSQENGSYVTAAGAACLTPQSLEYCCQ
jgi:hypothetical protein